MTDHPRSRPHPSPLVLSLIAGMVAAPLCGQDVEFAGVVKTQYYLQFDAKLLSLPDEEALDGAGDLPAPFFFEAFVESADTDILESASVTPPGGSELPLPVDPDSTNEWRLRAERQSFPELNAEFPPGAYELSTVGDNDGAKSVSVTLSADDYLGATTFTVFEAAQAIDPASDFTFAWDSIPGATADDLVFLILEDERGDEVFESPDIGEPGALDGLSTSAMVPSEALAPGTRYFARLETYRIVDVNESYAPGVESLAGYGKVLLMPAATTGVADSDAPLLESVSPYDQESDVALDATVVFGFNEAMDPAVDPEQAIAWTGIADPSDFSYRWSPDGRTLFCLLDGGLPASTAVGWELNPDGSSAKLADLAGNPLFAGVAGGFETGTSAGNAGPDVERFEIGKARSYRQEADGAPTAGHFLAGFFADPTGAGRLSSIDLEIPGRGLATDVGELGGDFWEIEGTATFAEQADLDRIFPNGSYTVSFHTLRDGDRSVTLETGADDYPNAPTMLDFAATQAVDPDQALVLQWQPMAGGTASDSIELFIGNDDACFFETPPAGEPGALDGTATQVTIPAGSLPPGRTLDCELVFARVADEDDSQYPGVSCRAGFFAITTLDLVTTGEPFEPRIEVQGQGEAALVVVTGERGRSYQVSASDDLSFWQPQWTQFVFGDDDGDFRGSFEFPAFVEGLPTRFYRAEEDSDSP